MKKIVNSIYDVYSGKLPRSFDGMKIAMLSDLHDNVYGISLEKLYGMIVEQEPELVIVAEICSHENILMARMRLSDF